MIMARGSLIFKQSLVTMVVVKFAYIAVRVKMFSFQLIDGHTTHTKPFGYICIYIYIYIYIYVILFDSL